MCRTLLAYTSVSFVIYIDTCGVVQVEGEAEAREQTMAIGMATIKAELEALQAAASRAQVCCQVIGQNTLILAVGLTNEERSNWYQQCSVIHFNVDWDCSFIDLKVPGEKTQSSLS